MRFDNVQLPQGAIIQTAYLKLTGYSAPIGTPPNITIYAEKKPNPSPSTVADSSIGTEISGRPRTSNSVVWTSPVFSVNVQYQSPDISAIIQEIVNQATWQSNNAVHIIADVGASTTGNSNDVYSWDGNPSRSPILEVTYTLASGVQTAQKKKRFAHKLYNGSTFVGTIPDSIVMNQPKFSWSVNGGMGEMNIDLALKISEFRDSYENSTISLGFRVITSIQGADEILSTQIYDGLLTSYDPLIDENGKEMVRLHVVSQVTTLENLTMKDGSGNTQLTYSSQSPDTILKDLIDKYNGDIEYTASSVDATGTLVSYVFTFCSFLDAIKKVLELSPAYWYWAVDAYSTIYFKMADFELPEHTLYIGKHIQRVDAKKSIDQLKNAIYFKGGGDPQLYKKYERQGSIEEYGRREERMSDERVTLAATAQTISDKFLDERDHPISIVQITIADNSIDQSAGYDIESFRPGQIVQMIDPRSNVQKTLWDVATWDVDFWDFDIRYSIGLPMQIRQVNYNFFSVTLELSARFEDVAKRIEDIKRNLDVVRSEGIPSVPS